MADPDLQKRLETFSNGRKKSRAHGMGVGALALALGLGGAAVAFWLASSGQDGSGPLETSEVDPFQDGQPGGGRLEFPPDEAAQRVNDALIAVEDALIVPDVPPPEPSREVLDEIARLREALAASQSERNAEIQAAVRDLRAAFNSQTGALEQRVAERERDLTALERENDAKLASLQSLLEAEQAQRKSLEAELQKNFLIEDQELLEERRRQEEAERLREAEREAAELLTAQIRSPAIVFADGRGGTVAPSGPAGTGAANPGAPIDENEAYLQRAARPLQVEEASRMAFPDRTLVQGSVIQAALQTAINSDLPGNVVAVVSEPVPAFSGDRVLIPRGSRLFGQYRSGIEVNQKRILVLWTRILTPDGTSMNIAAVGGGPLGRSGLTGFVDTKFAERFGGAALISIIGAAPSIASEQAQDEVTIEVLENIGEDLADATSSVIADQVSIAPTIYVDQGAGVTVLVDRDVVIY
ncbi:TrbI/VirB10 family protein [Sedimentitalea sp. JM2-8]|uniref:TrbI/VirB10 family protein n=1 Tax=Sedimentitalea xiamensis TaxID=3050037 RepID=A0ABT7FKC0_9RHOB|nr:TrbI/VirB10 family protein [Sedimentitalea xiamensis]MDK3075410.1 TrbI/VirB10 family protein [Sedimentitalea xiamensis]